MGTFLGSLRPAPDFEELGLRPLTEEEIRALVDDDDVAGAIGGETDRTPLAVNEVLRALAGRGAIERDLRGRWRSRSALAGDLAREEARAGQRRAIEALAARLSPERRAVLTVLALIGREVPARLLAQASGMQERQVLSALDGLVRAQLAHLGDKGWAVAHDVIRETIAHALAPGERMRLHGQIARALEKEGAEASEIAGHLSGAGIWQRPPACFALGLFQDLGDAHGVAGVLDLEAMATFMGGRIREGVQALDRAGGTRVRGS